MIVRIAAFGLLALGLGGFGTVAWIATRPPPPVPSPAAAPVAPLVHHIVLAAANALRAGPRMK